MDVKLGNETKTIKDSHGNEHVLHRAYRGDYRGGWIEKPENIGPNGGWVDGEAMVYGDALVDDGSIVRDHAVVCDKAVLGGDPWGAAHVEGNAVICDNGRVISGTVKGNAKVCENGSTWHGTVTDNAVIKGDASVIGHGFLMCDNAVADGHAEFCEGIFSGNARIDGHALVMQSCLSDNAVVRGDAKVIGCYLDNYSGLAVMVKDSAVIEGDTKIDVSEDDRKTILIGGSAHIDKGEISEGIFGITDEKEIKTLQDYSKICYRDIWKKHMTPQEVKEMEDDEREAREIVEAGLAEIETELSGSDFDLEL